MRFLFRLPILVGYSKKHEKFMMHSYSTAIIDMRLLISRINSATINDAIIFISDYRDAFLKIAD